MKPILFSTKMVQAILAGNKTQTRREMSFCKKIDGITLMPEFLNICVFRELKAYKDDSLRAVFDTDEDPFSQKCSYGKIGDVLWVRETFMIGPNYPNFGPKYYYKASVSDQFISEWPGYWKPSIFMPFEACRLFLEVTNIRVERLQDISEQDAIAEGVQVFSNGSGFRKYALKNGKVHLTTVETAKESYQTLWESINEKGSWENNPYVWVISFKKIDKPVNN